MTSDRASAGVFGKPTFLATAIGIGVNAVPSLTSPYSMVFIAMYVFAAEVLAVAILCFEGGMARQAGYGIVLSWLVTVAAVALGLVV